MSNFKKSCFAEPFSHVYIEREVRDAPLVQQILRAVPHATTIEIESYRHVFNRPAQNFELQKKNPKLILAQKQPPFLYPFSQKCQQGQFSHALYTTPALGCRFDCDFCFLHGMYNSANIVIFVNIDDIFHAVQQEAIRCSAPLLLSISYETDLLALERFCGLTSQWIEFCRQHPTVFVECRTRSSRFTAIEHLTPPPNFLLSWSLNPDAIIAQMEHGAPPLQSRLSSIESAISKGWKVRVCFDPILPVDQWPQLYQQLFEAVFRTVPASQLYDVTVGPFRMGKEFARRISKQRPWCELFYENVEIETTAFNRDILTPLRSFVPEEKLVIWESQL